MNKDKAATEKGKNLMESLGIQSKMSFFVTLSFIFVFFLLFHVTFSFLLKLIPASDHEINGNLIFFLLRYDKKQKNARIRLERFSLFG